jgi:hypothetical protein
MDLEDNGHLSCDAVLLNEGLAREVELQRIVCKRQRRIGEIQQSRSKAEGLKKITWPATKGTGTCRDAMLGICTWGAFLHFFQPHFDSRTLFFFFVLYHFCFLFFVFGG